MSAEDNKSLVKDTLVAMYLEQQNMARHHEIQRSAVTTIFTSLAVADIGLIGILLQRDGFNYYILPLTFTLIFLGIVGFLITTKLFERSMVHFHLSEAYLQTINALVADDVSELLKDKIEGIKYIADAKGEIGFTRMTQGAKPSEAFAIETNNYNPVDPRGIVEPRHNETAVYWKINFSKLNLFTLWTLIYSTFTILGVLLSLIVGLKYLLKI